MFSFTLHAFPCFRSMFGSTILREHANRAQRVLAGHRLAFSDVCEGNLRPRLAFGRGWCLSSAFRASPSIPLRSVRLPSLGENEEEFGMIECLRFISYIFSFTILCLLFVSKCGKKLRNTQRTHLGGLYELGDTSRPSSHSAFRFGERPVGVRARN